MAQCDGFQKHPENINRNGRPKKGDSWADIVREALGEIVDFKGTKKDCKRLIIEVQRKRALKGDLKSAEFLHDIDEGKVTQKTEIAGPGGGPVQNTVKIEFVEPGKEE